MAGIDPLLASFGNCARPKTCLIAVLFKRCGYWILLQRSPMSKMNTAIAEMRRSGGFALKAFVAFLFHPTLDVQETEAISRKAMTLWLLLFSFVATAIFAVLALPFLIYTNFEPGTGLRAVLDQSVISVILAVVILGPLVEEVIFRGWLTGTVRAFVGSALFLAIWFGGSWLLTKYLPQATGPGPILGLAAAGLFAFIAVNRNKRENNPAWYKYVFPLVFCARFSIRRSSFHEHLEYVADIASDNDRAIGNMWLAVGLC